METDRVQLSCGRELALCRSNAGASGANAGDRLVRNRGRILVLGRTGEWERELSIDWRELSIDWPLMLLRPPARCLCCCAHS